MSVIRYRNVYGGEHVQPVYKKCSAAVAKDDVVVAATDGTISACADHATSGFGWAMCAGAKDEIIPVIPAYPGQQAFMPCTGVYADANLEDFVGLAVANSAQTVDVANVTQKIFKLHEYVTDPDGTAGAWVSIPASISQAMVEVD
jgi:hypothetical protein